MYRLRRFIPHHKQIEIVPLGDIHYESPNCNVKKLKETIQYISQNPSTYCIGMGDFFDSIVTTDKRYDPTQKKFPLIEEAYQELKKILSPIKDRFLCMLIGNHEYHLVTSGYSNLIQRLCEEFRTAYAGFSSFLKVELKENPRKNITFYLHHGFFGGR